MGWESMRSRMLNQIAATFKDGTAQYASPDGAAPVCGVSVIIDRNLMQSGPDGIFPSDSIGVTWRKPELHSVTRGGIFTILGERLMVEDVISDDGHMITAACMVAP